MNAKLAKEISLKVWEYLRDNPHIKMKEDLPDEIWNLIEPILGHCPLCHMFEGDCKDCPLWSKENDEKDCNPAYYNWLRATYSDDGDEKRRISASKIVELVKNWDITIYS